MYYHYDDMVMLLLRLGVYPEGHAEYTVEPCQGYEVLPAEAPRLLGGGDPW